MSTHFAITSTPRYFEYTSPYYEYEAHYYTSTTRYFDYTTRHNEYTTLYKRIVQSRTRGERYEKTLTYWCELVV